MTHVADIWDLGETGEDLVLAVYGDGVYFQPLELGESLLPATRRDFVQPGVRPAAGV